MHDQGPFQSHKAWDSKKQASLKGTVIVTGKRENKKKTHIDYNHILNIKYIYIYIYVLVNENCCLMVPLLDFVGTEHN